MNYSAMIQNRKSVRAFTDKKVPYSVAQEIETYYQTSVKRLVPQLETELYIFRDDVKSALEGAAGYNQFLVGAPQYLVLLSEKDELAEINAGFIMENLVLNLTDMDLDTCWVTFTDSEQVKDALGIESSKDVAAIAAGRPDAQDEALCRQFAKDVTAKLEKPTSVSVPGNDPYVELKPSPFHPTADENCVRCGFCAQQCPVCAIPLDDPSRTNNDVCINCMRCVQVCPQQCRSLPVPFVAGATKMLSEKAAGYKKPAIFL